MTPDHPSPASHPVATRAARAATPPSPAVCVTSSIIAASAGTGKTYQLSQRFIALLALGVPAEQMIALTFTRKAAGEFCDRILRDLASGAASDTDAQQLAARVRSTWYGTGGAVALCPVADEAQHPLTRESFHRMLRELIQALGKVKLSTLDSFFFQMLRANTFDLGLGSLSLLDEQQQQQARQQALESLFGSISDDESELYDFLRNISNTYGSHRGNIRQELESFIDDFSELFLAAPALDTWRHAAAFDLPDLTEAPELPGDYYRRAAKRMEHLATSDNGGKRLRQLLLAFPGKMENHDFSSIATILKNISSPPPSANPALLSMLDLASTLYHCTREQVMRECQQRTLAVYKILAQYQQHYQALIRNSGRFDFSDITRQIPKLLDKQGAPTRLAFRLDSSLHHWMLDEFQDTSREQWNALRPMLGEILTEVGTAPDHAASRSLFVVGDSKQSIYGWRGATAAIFRRLRETPGLQPMSMVTSWRSAKPVLDFVNEVFHYDSTDLEHRPAPRNQSLTGLVQVSSYDEHSDDGEALCTSIRSILDTLPLADKQLSVGILVRRNTEADTIARWLQRHTTYTVKTVGDIPMGTDSPLGETLLSFFRWLAHPQDSYSHAVWRNSPLQPLIDAGNTCWQDWRQRLEQGGFSAVLQHLQNEMRRTGLQLSDFHAVRLRRWLLAAADFDRSGGSLIEWIERMQGLTIRENPPKNTIQVLTVHKSKGLEYDAVILPMAGIREPHNTQFLRHLISTDAEGSIRGVILPPANQAARDLWPELAPHVDAWKQQQIEENRNLLYVALTRAARANYILVNNRAKPDREYHGGIILSALRRMSQRIDDKLLQESPTLTRPIPCSKDTTGLLFTMGNSDWHRELPLKSSDTVQQKPGATLPPPTPRRTRRSPSLEAAALHDATILHDAGILQDTRIPHNTIPPHDTPPPHDSAPHPDTVNPPGSPDHPSQETSEIRAAAMRFGTDVHALLEPIIWLDPAAPPPWYTHPSTPAEHTASAALHDPDISRFFTPTPGAEAYTEQSLEAVSGTTWYSAIIDRLILYPAQQRAIILDFKTNRSAHGLKELYLPQMRAYRKLVAAATGYPLQNIHVALLHLSATPTILRYTDSDWNPPQSTNTPDTGA